MTSENGHPPPASVLRKVPNFISRVYGSYDFPIHILLAMLVAKVYPPLGAIYLQPQITATWLAVIIIFIIVGLGLKTKELSRAFQQLHFNLFVQCYNFGVVSLLVFSITKLLTTWHVLNPALADGMVICASLPMAINCLIVLTSSTGGNDAAALFNTSFANIVGIFVSPLIILAYLGTSGSVDKRDTYSKLALIVILPMSVGWVLQNYVTVVRNTFVEHKRIIKKTQESCLVFIIYTVFCRKFYAAAALKASGSGDSASPATLSDVLFMIGLEMVLMATLMGLAWYLLGLQFPNEPELRVTGLFACHHKTVALGVPLINSMYEHHPNVALYTLPVLVWHPMQLVVGSFLIPSLSAFVQAERQRLDAQEADYQNIEAAGVGAAVAGETTPLVR